MKTFTFYFNIPNSKSIFSAQYKKQLENNNTTPDEIVMVALTVSR